MSKIKLGRIPSINQQRIRDAVRLVAEKSDITMYAVANALGVNVTTLYRHTGGLGGLRKIHAMLLSEHIDDVPSTKEKTWKQWLYELAGFYRQAFHNEPILLKYAQTALDPNFKRLEDITSTLVNYGFTPRDAVRAHAFLINNVVGYVHQEIQLENDIEGGMTPIFTSLAETMKKGGEHLDTLSHLHFSDSDLDADANFNYFMNFAVSAIAVNLE